MFRSFRARLTALYLALFSLLFILFSLFLYSEFSRSLIARLDQTLSSEADTAAVLFDDEFHEMKDAVLAAREVVSEMKLHGDLVTVREGSRILAPTSEPAPHGRGRIASRVAHTGGRTYEIEVWASLDSI